VSIPVSQGSAGSCRLVPDQEGSKVKGQGRPVLKNMVSFGVLFQHFYTGLRSKKSKLDRCSSSSQDAKLNKYFSLTQPKLPPKSEFWQLLARPCRKNTVQTPTIEKNLKKFKFLAFSLCAL